ncbi:hypothetical protein [Geodermatophilus obscurus]|nr:hypothetical protein [Geodermatophilus obscurus]
MMAVLCVLLVWSGMGGEPPGASAAAPTARSRLGQALAIAIVGVLAL